MKRAQQHQVLAGSALLCALSHATPMSAGTVEPWFNTETTSPIISVAVTSPPFGELLQILTSHFISSGPYSVFPSASALLFQMVVLMVGLIVCLRHRSITQPYALLTELLARSRTLWIIALRPFDRWADKWSFKPSRPSSSAASTSSTSETVNPS